MGAGGGSSLRRSGLHPWLATSVQCAIVLCVAESTPLHELFDFASTVPSQVVELDRSIPPLGHAAWSPEGPCMMPGSTFLWQRKHRRLKRGHCAIFCMTLAGQAPA